MENKRDIASMTHKHVIRSVLSYFHGGIPPGVFVCEPFLDDHLKHIAFERNLFAKPRSLFKTKLVEVLSIKSSVGLDYTNPFLRTILQHSLKDLPADSSANRTPTFSVINPSSSDGMLYRSPIWTTFTLIEVL